MGIGGRAEDTAIHCAACTTIGCESGGSFNIALIAEADVATLAGATIEVCLNGACRSAVIQEVPAASGVLHLDVGVGMDPRCQVIWRCVRTRPDMLLRWYAGVAGAVAFVSMQAEVWVKRSCHGGDEYMITNQACLVVIASLFVEVVRSPRRSVLPEARAVQHTSGHRTRRIIPRRRHCQTRVLLP